MTGRTRTFHRHQFQGRYLFLGFVVTALALSGCMSESEPPGDHAGSSASSGPMDEPSDGAAVKVAEKAVTATEDSTGPMASYAIIVENHSADVAVATRLEIRLLDEDGETIKDKVVDRDLVSTNANLVMPGEQQAVTNTTYTGREGVASIEVEVADTTWYPGDDKRFSAVTATDVTVASPDEETVITFKAESPYEKELSTVATYAVYRDADGNLLGGSAPNDARPLAYEPGVNSGEIEISSGLPSKWEPDATKVYIDPLIQV